MNIISSLNASSNKSLKILHKIWSLSHASFHFQEHFERHEIPAVQIIYLLPFGERLLD